MRTPKEYVENLKNGIITEDMFSDCVFSVNKRAKNYRDNARVQRREYGWRAETGHNDAEKDKYYREKDFFLSFLEPVCIHKEPAGYLRVRIYDYEPEYKKNRKYFVWENCYFDRDRGREVWFGDIEDRSNPQYRWYLYYVLGTHSFHHPIDGQDVKNYPDHKICLIDALDTHGMETCNLLSTQFVNKVMIALCEGRCILSFDGHKNPLPIIQAVPDFVILPEVKEKYIPKDRNITTICFRGEEMPVEDFVIRFSHDHGGRDYFIKAAKERGMEIRSRTTMAEAIEYLKAFNDSDIFLIAADELGIGVEKRSFIDAGMPESQYKRISGKLSIVGKRQTKSGYKNIVNEYSVRQYLNWRNTGEIS